jgi:hypothetical protein
VTALWWVTLPLLLVGGGWMIREWRRDRMWQSVGKPGWWKAAPGTCYNSFGNVEGRR